MNSRRLLPILLALPLCAQAPAETRPVRFILQADPPPAGTPALDTAAILNALQAFAKGQQLIPPSPDGDGWVLDIHLAPLKSREGVVIAKAFLRVSRTQQGKVAAKGVMEDTVTIASDRVEHWGQALAAESWNLLSVYGVVATKPVITQEEWKRLEHPAGDVTVECDISDVRVVNSPKMPPVKVALADGTAPPKGWVEVDQELTIDQQGRPIWSVAKGGREDLLVWGQSWAMGWVFRPPTLSGRPCQVRFPLSMHLRLH